MIRHPLRRPFLHELQLLSLFAVFGCLSGQAASESPSAIFKCRDDFQKAINDRGLYFEYYDQHFNTSKSLQNFRKEPYGGRRQSVQVMAENMKDHKLDVFAPELKNGDHIFESGCGEGLNLLITVELLRDSAGINITAHGIDYLTSSVELAHRIFDQEAPSHKGTFCQGDATDLSYIPSNSFDLTYTGFIDPLADPLNLWPEDYVNDDMDTEENSAHMSALYCDEEDELLWAVAQREQKLQEDWHAAWVGELIRIAKPGKLIVIEDVAWSTCTSREFDVPDEGWGGVDPEWWEEAAEIYGWPIDPESIEMTQGWYENRYIVYMRKLLQEAPQPEDQTASSTS